MTDQAPLQRDLHTHADRHFLVPSALELTPGGFVLRRIDGLERSVIEADVLPFEVSLDQARAFHEAAVEDARQRVGLALGAVAQLLGAARTGQVGTRPASLDEAVGLGGGAESDLRATQQSIEGLQRLVAMAQADPAALRALTEQVAPVWEGTGMDTLLAALPEALIQGLAPADDDEPDGA